MSEIEHNTPRHIAIIMDGNGRWAKKQGVPVSAGHKAGVEALGHIVKSCEKHDISVLTLFAFSRENWQRPEKEVSALMSLFSLYLNKEINNLHDNGVRVRFIGSRENLADKLLKKMEHAERLTQDNTALTVVMAVDYSGVWDLVQATKSITQDALSGDVTVDDIDDALLTSHLSLSDIGAPDLCIRTSGEHRISNFLLLQLAYSELYFTDVLWPDFSEHDLNDAIKAYSMRQRRFGRRDAL